MDIRSAVMNVSWNCFLALIPVGLAYALAWAAQVRGKKAVKGTSVLLIGAAWFLFLPNTCYLITEWRHFMAVVDFNDLFIRMQEQQNPVLFVKMCAFSMFFVFYSGFGMMTFAVAIRPVKRVVERRGISAWASAIPFFIAISMGVYLGLVLRFNTWDAVTHPWMLWHSVIEIAMQPRLTLFLLAFAVFLWTAYWALDIWIDGFAERWRIIKRMPAISRK